MYGLARRPVVDLRCQPGTGPDSRTGPPRSGRVAEVIFGVDVLVVECVVVVVLVVVVVGAVAGGVGVAGRAGVGGWFVQGAAAERVDGQGPHRGGGGVAVDVGGVWDA